ncbi:hypothetical protein V499_00488 [Pseudogymnoascus sp. VKM F-103]|uniref:Autophagy-related protein 3 n=1 Tax=Pseudogymnoascus verrucosus TaxID=342668 RepID=A0A1B8GB05_9PEZI|nr:E2-like enzyme [Pseudogymnoascus verrucosus]KFY80660.1 hypothetical protein V499_00488 [Pseudogymnoascus sp. VKM F-103]OBT93008.1 E2-like enzyme [Pseudogymnoascus verrucosus]
MTALRNLAHSTFGGFAHSTLDMLRERYPGRIPDAVDVEVRKTGQLHPEHFVAAGDYITKWFPVWQWKDLPKVEKEIGGKTDVEFEEKTEGEFVGKITGLPTDRHILVCRKIPCRRRLGEFADDATMQEETMVRDGEDFTRDVKSGSPGDDGGGWLRTGSLAASQEARAGDVRTVDESGNMADKEPDEPDDIPDMEIFDDDPDALIRDYGGDSDEEKKSSRFYDIFIVYSAAYLTPRVYLQGYDYKGAPLTPPELMLQDIMGDYTDKTVTIEKFPHYSGNIQMASIHPCKHAELMKTLFLRADNALKIRREKQRKGLVSDGPADLQSLIGDVDKLSLAHDRKGEPKGKGEDEWEVVDTDDSPDQEEAAISIDQYLVVFLKFLASVTPTIEFDNTMAL